MLPLRGRSLAGAALGLLALAHGGYAGAPPADPRAAWRVGFSALRAVHLTADDAYLGSAIPRLLRERLAPIRRHRLSADERRAHAQRVLAGAVRAASERLRELQRERDQQVLARADTAAVDEQLATVRGRLRELRDLPLEELEIAAHKPVALAAAGSDDPLLPAPRFSPLQATREADLDLLITGELEEVEGVLFLQIDALDSNLGRRVLSHHDVLRPERADATLRELEQRLARLLVGEPWGTLSVRPNPAHSAVYVDGAFAGFGVTELPYQTLGAHTIRVTAPGHEPLEREVALAGSGLTLAPALVPVPSPPVTIVSQPPGAALYLDARYLGVTPLQVAVTERPARLLLRLAGYRDAALILRPGSALPRVDLVPDEYDRAARQEQQRDRFYGRLGALVVSLAGPLILFTAAGEEGQRVAAGAGAAANHDLLIGGGVLSLTLSGALLVRTLAAIGDYLAAASEGAR